MKKMRRIAHLTTFLILGAWLLTACNNTVTDPNLNGHPSNTPSVTSVNTVALVTDLEDQDARGLSQLATAGYVKAQEHYGFPSLVIPTTTPNDAETNLNMAAQEADLVIVVGFFMQTSLDKVARAFPDKKFAMVDGCAVPDPSTGDCEKLPNVVSLYFNEQEAGCLVGALAAQMEIDGPLKSPKLLGKQTIGAIGSQPLPSVTHYIAGYTYCAKKVDPRITIVVSYANEFLDPAACQALAESQILNQQADILFQVASACGLGVLDAATARHVYSIGVDIDQSRDATGKVRAGVITSALKRADTAVYAIIDATEHGQFDALVNKPPLFDAAHDGIGFAPPGPGVPQDAVDKAKEYEYEMQTGKLIPPM